MTDIVTLYMTMLRFIPDLSISFSLYNFMSLPFSLEFFLFFPYNLLLVPSPLVLLCLIS